MNPTGTSQFNQGRIEWAIRMRYSPMPNLDMKWLAANLNAFRIGELRGAAKIWEVMMERDGELALNADKRNSDLAGLEWQVVSDGSLVGDQHAEALNYFYRNLRATRALDQDSTGGMSELLYQMASAHSYYYSAHEILMRIDNPAAREVTAEFRQTPVWFFESRRGYLAYLQHIFDVYGEPCLRGEWLTCVGLGWMRPLCMAFAMKHFQLRDWLVFCQRYGSGFIEAITEAQKGDAAWEEARETLQAISNDGAVIHSQGLTLKFLDNAAKNSLPFEALVDRVDRLYAKCYRGIDLATSSRGAEAGSGHHVVGASIQKEESGIFLMRDASWATGCLNERVDRPVIKYLFNQEPKAWVVVMPPLDDTAGQDLRSLQALVPMGLRISLAEVYKRFRWKTPAAGEECLRANQTDLTGENGGEMGKGIEGNLTEGNEGKAGEGSLTGGSRGSRENDGKDGMNGKYSANGTMAMPGTEARTMGRECLTEGNFTGGNEGNEERTGKESVGGTAALPGTEVSQAIGAGANPGAEVQFASGEMPSPQAGAAGFFKNQSQKEDFTEGNEGNEGKTREGAIGGTTMVAGNEKVAGVFRGQS